MLPTGQAWIFFLLLVVDLGDYCLMHYLNLGLVLPLKNLECKMMTFFIEKKRIYFTIWQMQSWPLLIKTSSQWRLNIKANDLFYVNDFLLEHKRLFIMDFSVLRSVTKANGVIFSLPGLSFWSKSRCYFYKLNSWNLLQKSNFKELVVELIIKEKQTAY